jgi:hypothetical protein
MAGLPSQDAKTLDGAEVPVPRDEWHAMMPGHRGNPEVIGRNGGAGGL